MDRIKCRRKVLLRKTNRQTTTLSATICARLATENISLGVVKLIWPKRNKRGRTTAVFGSRVCQLFGGCILPALIPLFAYLSNKMVLHFVCSFFYIGKFQYIKSFITCTPCSIYYIIKTVTTVQWKNKICSSSGC